METEEGKGLEECEEGAERGIVLAPDAMGVRGETSHKRREEGNDERKERHKGDREDRRARIKSDAR